MRGPKPVCAAPEVAVVSSVGSRQRIRKAMCIVLVFIAYSNEPARANSCAQTYQQDTDLIQASLRYYALPTGTNEKRNQWAVVQNLWSISIAAPEDPAFDMNKDCDSATAARFWLAAGTYDTFAIANNSEAATAFNVWMALNSLQEADTDRSSTKGSSQPNYDADLNQFYSIPGFDHSFFSWLVSRDVQLVQTNHLSLASYLDQGGLQFIQYWVPGFQSEIRNDASE